MSVYKSEYETRLLYTQSYMADDAVNVSTDVHAVLWAYAGSTPTTTRIRLTYIYTSEVKGISPVQGLIEQWKPEGWTVIDEFCDGYQDFTGLEDFRAHMLEMTRAFLLGVPFGAEVQGSDLPKGPPIRKTGLKIPKPGSITSRLDSIIKKSSEDKDGVNNDEDDDIYAKAIKVTRVIPEDEFPVEAESKDTPKPDVSDDDDDDDDDWI